MTKFTYIHNPYFFKICKTENMLLKNAVVQFARKETTYCRTPSTKCRIIYQKLEQQIGSKLLPALF